MSWENNWPAMSDKGVPVVTGRKPDVGANYPGDRTGLASWARTAPGSDCASAVTTYCSCG